MNAVSVYVTTAKLVLQSTETSSASATSSNPELSRLLLSLRQLLSCVVCNRLVNDPYAPQNGECAHNVCRLCIRGQKKLHPVCKYCKDFKDFKAYNENKQMRCLLMCYKSLCEHLRYSAAFNALAGHKVGQYNNTSVPSVIVPQMSMQELIVEGAGYDDIMNVFNYELNSAKQVLVPPVKQTYMPALVTPLTSIAAATPLAPIQQANKTTGMQHTASKASTPPICVTGANSVPITTYGPKIKIENSSNQLLKHQTSATTKPISNVSNVEHQSTITTHPQLIQFNHLKNSGNITLIGTNTRGIVVPIVSSSGSSAVPLSIASSRLQTLNRQMAHARALAVSSNSTANTSSTIVNTTPLSNEHRTPLSTFKVSLASAHTLKTIPSFTCSTSIAPVSSSIAVSATSQVRNPPPIKTVSNGSAMYSVLYTGIGNKITIKRKTDGDEEAIQKKNSSTSTSNPNVLRPVVKISTKKRGCRCGNTTATPGKLTCCGQRCPCYVDSKSCIGCKCRGCRNPHRPDGNKVRPIIPELACYEIQMADDLGNVNELPITSNSLNAFCTDINNATISHANTLNVNSTASTTTVRAASTSSQTSNLIPVKTLNNFSTSSLNSASTIPSITSTAISTQTTSMTQASFGHTTLSSINPIATSPISSNITTPGNIVQLDQIQRESLLIQNVEGKFQVVNLFTTGGGNSSGGISNVQTPNQLSTIQRIQTMPSTVASTQNSFILPTYVSSSSIAGTTTTTSLPQFLLQSQQHPHHAQHMLQQIPQQQNHHQTLVSQRMPNNVNTSSLPLQLQQQLKQNIITVHSIHANPTTNTSPITAPVLTPSSSPAPISATINLPPPLLSNKPHSQPTTTLDFTNSVDVSRNSYTNRLASSSGPIHTTSTSSSITTIPLSSVTLSGTVHSQSLGRKSLNSPNT